MSKHKIIVDQELASQMGDLFALVDPDEYRLDCATELLLQGLPEAAVEMIMRTDAATSSSTPYTRDELVHVLTTIYEEQYMRNTVQEAFGFDDSIRPGALTWRAHRLDVTGEPEIIGDGGRSNDAPEITLSNDFEDFPIDYYRIDVSQTYLEQLAESTAARTINTRARKMKAARAAVDRFVDKRAWLRAFDNPYVPLFTTTQKIGEDQNASDMHKVMRRFINYIINAVQGHNSELPTVLWTSPRMHAVLNGKSLDNNREKTLIDELIKRTSINEVKTSPRLTNIGGTGVDGMVLLPSNSGMKVMRALKFTTMPGQRIGLVTKFINVAGDGGLNFVDSVGSSVGYFEWEA
jgi:hypothetical protein